jgi:hypothetical protein
MAGTFAMLMLLLAAPQEAAPVLNPPTFAGIYFGELPAASGSGKHFRLSLKLDGSATWREAHGDKGVVVSDGRWTAIKDRVTLTFSPTAGSKALAPITWTLARTKLTPVEWDRDAWGSAGPPRLTKLTGGVRHIPEKPVVK